MGHRPESFRTRIFIYSRKRYRQPILGRSSRELLQRRWSFFHGVSLYPCYLGILTGHALPYLLLLYRAPRQASGARSA